MEGQRSSKNSKDTRFTKMLDKQLAKRVLSDSKNAVKPNRGRASILQLQLPSVSEV